MSLLADLWQDWKIGEEAERTTSLETRVRRLERELRRTQRLLHDVVRALDRHLDEVERQARASEPAGESPTAG